MSEKKKDTNNEFDLEKYEDDGFEPVSQESTILKPNETVMGEYLGDQTFKGRRKGIFKKSHTAVYLQLKLDSGKVIRMPKAMDLKRQFTVGSVRQGDILKIRYLNDVQLSGGRSMKKFEVLKKRT